MDSLYRFVCSVAALPTWLKFVYIVSLTWAVGHCLICAYAPADVRLVAAMAGAPGAAAILVTLHVGIRHYIWLEVERESQRIRAELTAASFAQRPLAPPTHQE